MVKIISVVLLIILPLLLVQFQGSLGREASYTRVVNITNELGSEIGLTIHCKSENNDLGEHNLPFLSWFSWSFKSDLFLTTDFYCYMWWNNVSGNFDVYKASRDDERCASKCWWRITTIGAFSYNEVLDRWDLIHIWQK